MVDYKCKKCNKEVTHLDEIKHKEIIESGLCGYCNWQKFCKDYYPDLIKKLVKS